MVKKYYKRWVREYPRIQVYVSKEDYDKIKELAFNMGLSVSIRSSSITCCDYCYFNSLTMFGGIKL